MGEVYLGHDPRLERRVALKCLIASGATRDEDQARILREARAAARLNHPNIAAVYDVLQQDDRTFIVMEYVEGESLATRMARGRVPIEQVRAIGRQLASALGAAHAQGVIHRDLKPANIHIAPDGTVKVLDFGVAKIEHAAGAGAEHTVSSQNPGTPIYMSPEQLFGQALDPRSDVYSAGAILYQLATSQRPFDELNPVALALAMQSHNPKAPHLVSSDVPRDLSEIIMKMLARDPVDRFQSIRDVETLLTTTIDASAVLRHPLLQPRVKRRTVVWTGVAAAAVLVAIAALGRPLLHPAPVPPAARAGVDSIAVLPLENLSADPSQEYIADGMTESIITELGRVRSLRVISRQSMMQFKHTRATVPQIAAQLGVHSVMTGSVTRDGDRLHVTVALMDPLPEHQLWAETYERRIGDVLALSSEVAQTMMKAVRVTVTPDEAAQLASARPISAEAQQAYLRGRFFWNKRTKADNQRAMDEYAAAITADGNAAVAYAGLADCYTVAIDNGWVPADEAFRQAKANANRAIAIDDNIAEAHAALGMVYQLSLLFPQAEQEFKRSLALNPGYAAAHQWYSIELRTLGRFSEAVAEARRALDIDPLSPVQTLFFGNQLYYAGDYEGAVTQIQRAIALQPDSAIGHELLGQAYLRLHKNDESIRELTRAVSLSPSASGSLGNALAVIGDRRAAQEVLDGLQRRARAEYVSPLQIALVHVGLGESDKAIDWIERAYRESERTIGVLAADPRLEPISADPRFQSILRRGGLAFRQGLVDRAH